MDIEERLQAIEKRLRIIEKWHNDRADAMTAADEAMDEALELEHGPY